MGTPAGVAFEQANLAEIHLLVEEVERAEALAAEAVASSLTQEDWSTPYALVAQARVRMRTQRGDLGVLDQAARLADDLGDEQARTEAAVAKAEWLISIGRADEARELLATHPSHAGAPILARAHLAAGRPHVAHDLANSELERSRAAGEQIAEVEALSVLAAALTELAEPAAASEANHAARELAERLPFPAALRRLIAR